MNQNIEKILNSIDWPDEIIEDENEYQFRRKLASDYLSYADNSYS